MVDDEDFDLIVYFSRRAPPLEIEEGKPWSYYLSAQHKFEWAEGKVASMSEGDKTSIRQHLSTLCTSP